MNAECHTYCSVIGMNWIDAFNFDVPNILHELI